MNGETLELSTLIALGGLMLTLIGLTGVVLYRLGQLAARADRQAAEMRAMREESRRNHQQLLQALAHHSHDPATGFATFQVPPGME